MKAYQVFYEGHVQGVGFRYSVRQLAAGYDVTGWVRNLQDGRVELQVKGDDDEVEDFLQGIQESDLGGLIRKTERQPIPPPDDLKGFTIR